MKMISNNLAALCFLAIGVVLSGYFLPWWGFVAPAFFVGAWFASSQPKSRTSSVALKSGGVTALLWMGFALVHDIETGGRLSARIASVMSMPGFLMSYLSIGIMAAVLAGLSASAGFIFFQLSFKKPAAENQRT